MGADGSRIAGTGTADIGRVRAADRVQLQQVLDALVSAGSAGALAQLRVGTDTWAGASGVAELGRPDPVAADGTFRIGSVAKTFTAVVVLQLVGEGRLGLDDTVERWLPDLVPGGAGITLRQLLDHTSGLHDYTDDLDLAGILRDRLTRWQPLDVIAEAVRHRPRFAPGTSRAYCNTAFILLGMVIEKATTSSYAVEVARRVLQPLDLRRTLVPADESLPAPHAHGYLLVDGGLVDVTAYNPSQAWSAGGMVSTAADLNVFFRALLTGGLLGPSELAAMRTTMPTGIDGVDGGLGVARMRLPDGNTVWGKDGGFFGYRVVSFHTADATRQLTVSVTTALADVPATHELLAGIADVFRAAAADGADNPVG